MIDENKFFVNFLFFHPCQASGGSLDCLVLDCGAAGKVKTKSPRSEQSAKLQDTAPPSRAFIN